MKIAVTYENEEIFQHFGHTSAFKIYKVLNGEVVEKKIVDTCGSGHGALAGMLQILGVDVLICGGIGAGARAALIGADIEVFGGVSGDCDSAIYAYLKGNLNYDPNAKCDHHDHHHSDGHSCGDHGCDGSCH